jgi:hypothetical protein
MQEKVIKDIEGQIEMHENDISELELTLCQPSTYNDKNLIINLNERLNILKNELEILYTNWTEVQEK